MTLGPAASQPFLGWSPYKPMLNVVNTSCEPWVESFAIIGQLQLLRCMISLKLSSSRKVLNKQGMLSAFCSPFSSIYMRKDSPPFLSRCMSIVTISQLSHYVFDPHLSTLTCQVKKGILDFSPTIIGLGTFLKQFHPTYMVEYIQYMGQYVQAVAETAVIASEPQKRTIDPASELKKSTFWLMNFCKHMEIPKDLFDSCLPPSLFTVLQT
uniref:WASH complex subunit strumpellin n=2 Tax=Anthurium amnicola TaxID=1678845 RepID=A0A1D1YM81_9ARAE